MNKVKYIVDEKGQKNAVLVPIQIWEDLIDTDKSDDIPQWHKEILNSRLDKLEKQKLYELKELDLE